MGLAGIEGGVGEEGKRREERNRSTYMGNERGLAGRERSLSMRRSRSRGTRIGSCLRLSVSGLFILRSE